MLRNKEETLSYIEEHYKVIIKEIPVGLVLVSGAEEDVESFFQDVEPLLGGPLSEYTFLGVPDAVSLEMLPDKKLIDFGLQRIPVHEGEKH